MDALSFLANEPAAGVFENEFGGGKGLRAEFAFETLDADAVEDMAVGVGFAGGGAGTGIVSAHRGQKCAEDAGGGSG